MSGSHKPLVLPETIALAERIWEFHQLRHQPHEADVIIALGTNDLRVAEHAASLYHQGMAPLIVCSGGVAHQNDLLATAWTRPEAEVYAGILQERGVPPDAILLEPSATNTSENIRFSRELLLDHGIRPKSILIAVKPFMQRRAAATYAVEWPEVPMTVSSWQTTFAEYCAGDLTVEKIIHIMMGDLQRIWVYGRKGYSAPQRIPAAVREAYNELKVRGFNRHLLEGEE
ncbi:MAG: YdcF family protein [Acidobacteria bacterium]|nr:YdcF family protein [Acidobacteriota bacterium]